MKYKKILISQHPRKQIEYGVSDLDKGINTKFGFVSKEELKSKKSAVKSDREQEFLVLKADFRDNYRRIKKGAQTMGIKDIAFIIGECGIGKESTVVEIGCGSGGASCMLGNIVKKVHSFDIDEKNIKVAKENCRGTGIKNVSFKKRDCYSGLPEKAGEADVVIIDVPEPWRIFDDRKKYKNLRKGKYVVSYSPSITQSQKFVNALLGIEEGYHKGQRNIESGLKIKNSDFKIIKTVEVIERKWRVFGEAVRPVTKDFGHSGFITIARKIR